MFLPKLYIIIHKSLHPITSLLFQSIQSSHFITLPRHNLSTNHCDIIITERCYSFCHDSYIHKPLHQCCFNLSNQYHFITLPRHNLYTNHFTITTVFCTILQIVTAHYITDLSTNHNHYHSNTSPCHKP